MSFFSGLTKGLGSLFSGMSSGGLFGLIGALGSDIFNVFSARSYRNWMTNMSSTAVQRRMKDLSSAGINPALAGGHSGAASQPSMSAPSVQSPVHSAVALMGAVQRLRNMRAQTNLVNAQAQLVRSNVRHSYASLPDTVAKSVHSASTLARDIKYFIRATQLAKIMLK